MLRFLPVIFVLLAMAQPALAEKWVKVDGQLYVDTDSLLTDKDGYTLYKTRELNAAGTSVIHQHKEATQCDANKHFFRKMYDGAAVVNNRNDADVKASTWADWRSSPREVYKPERIAALNAFVCARAKKK